MSNNSNKEKLIASAQKLVEKGQFDKAIREYLKAVSEDDSDALIWVRIGDLYVKLGQKSEAAENYKKVAQLYAQQGEQEKAAAVYKQILQIDPHSIETVMTLGGLYRDMGKPSHAIQQYERAAQLYNRAGKTRDALSAEQAIVDLSPDNVARRIRLAELYSKENLYSDAAREFGVCATYLRGVGRMEDFAKVSERLLFHQPENLEVTKDLARYYMQQSDSPRALAKLQAGFKIDRKDVELLDLLAQAFATLQKPDKAIAVLKELARIYTERGATGAADSVHHRILEMDPKDAEARAALSHSAPGPRRAEPGGAKTIQSNLIFNSPSPQPVPGPPKPVSGPLNMNLGPGTPLPTTQGRPLPSQHSGPALAPPANNPAANLSPTTAANLATNLAVTPAAGTRTGTPTGQQAAIAVTTGSDEDVARILNEAEAFAKLGLKQRAADHLANTLRSHPSLRPLRERLAQIYESLGQYKSALAELRTLLNQATSQEDEIRYLRDIVRLDNKDEAASSRLLHITGQHRIQPRRLQSDDPDEPEIEMSAEYEDDAPTALLPAVQAPADAAATARMSLQQFQQYVRSTTPRRTETEPSQKTPVHVEAVGAAAEELALTAGTLKEELDEVDFYLQQRNYVAAREQLQNLLVRYPHSRTVQAKLQEVNAEAAAGEVVIDVDVEVDEVPEIIEAPVRSPSGRALQPPLPSNQSLKPAPGMLSGPHRVDKPTPPSLPVSARSMPGMPGLSASGRSLPPPAPSGTSDKGMTSSEASGAFRLGVSFRNQGKYAQAIAEFQKAMSDHKKAPRAALMLGLCHRDQGQIKEAIEVFKEGIHLPGIADADLSELNYQLGRSYEMLGDSKEATYFFTQAQRPTGKFKDAAERVAALQAKSARSLR
ncbi:MAG: tetratricopeptide repeat protein [Polyangia bacterium]